MHIQEPGGQWKQGQALISTKFHAKGPIKVLGMSNLTCNTSAPLPILDLRLDSEYDRMARIDVSLQRRQHQNESGSKVNVFMLESWAFVTEGRSF